MSTSESSKPLSGMLLSVVEQFATTNPEAKVSVPANDLKQLFDDNDSLRKQLTELKASSNAKVTELEDQVKLYEAYLTKIYAYWKVHESGGETFERLYQMAKEEVAVQNVVKKMEAMTGLEVTPPAVNPGQQMPAKASDSKAAAEPDTHTAENPGGSSEARPSYNYWNVDRESILKSIQMYATNADPPADGIKRDYRIVKLGNLPRGITHKEVSATVRGGPLDEIYIHDDYFSSNGVYAKVKFLDEKAAADFFEVATQIEFDQVCVNVGICATRPMSKDIMTAVRRHNARRVLEIVPAAGGMFTGSEAVHDTLRSVSENGTRFCIYQESIEQVQILEGGGKARIVFFNLFHAIKLYQSLVRVWVGPGRPTVAYGRDECEGPVGELGFEEEIKWNHIEW